MAVESIIETMQFLTFKLGEELFALDIGKVREVLDFTSITKVPQTPEYMLGVINLRGSVIPVVDIRTKLRMAVTAKTVNTCVIIVEVELDGDKIVMGAMADAVQEVLDLEPDQIEPPPKFGTKANNDFIRGMGKHGHQFIIILDIDKVLSTDDISLLTEVTGGEKENEAA
jgi:purine-binding chemotaxis protein CheW